MISTPRRQKRQARPGAVFPSDVAAENIQTVRKRRNLSQQEVTDRMNHLQQEWQRPTLSQVEAGMRPVTVEELWGLALAMDTNIHGLLMPRAEMSSPAYRVDVGLDEPLGPAAIAFVLGDPRNEEVMIRIVDWDDPSHRPAPHLGPESARLDRAVEELRDELSAGDVDPTAAVQLFRAMLRVVRSGEGWRL